MISKEKCPICNKTMFPDVVSSIYFNTVIKEYKCSNCHSILRKETIRKRPTQRLKSLKEILSKRI